MRRSTGNQAAGEFLRTRSRAELNGELALMVWEPPVSYEPDGTFGEFIG